MNIRYRIQAAIDLLSRYWQVARYAWQQQSARVTPDLKAHEAEFLPAALSLQASPVSPAGRWVARILLLMIVIVAAWATFSHIDIVTVGQGKVAVTGEAKTISITQVGSLHALHVVENQRVHAGQLLIELDDREADSDLQKAEGERDFAIVQAAAQRALIDALNTGRTPRLARLPGITDERQRAGEQFLSNAWREYLAKRTRLDATIRQNALSLPIAMERENVYETLAKTRDVSQDAWVQKKLNRIEIEGRLSEARSQQLELVADTRKTAEDHMAESARMAQSASQDVARALARRSLMEVRSPVDGTVQQLSVHTIGAAVPAAQPLMQIVPLNDKVQFQAMIENKDVGFVREGESVAVKIDAFDYTRYGTLSGRVTHVSRDAIQDEKRGLLYAVRVEFDKPQIEVDGRKMQISAGMSGTVDIRTGSRRVIQYVLSPLVQHAQEGLRER
ncbi:HlyD family type I secretion periplasmic adaptor subunit [Neisseriaceae bacterium JH1-16]|nr:HlyD family type I secretion periplasmic adaptor subunit [Neisseriaceae bacterium JH1-16]